jgi:hypothetical protein
VRSRRTPGSQEATRAKIIAGSVLGSHRFKRDCRNTGGLEARGGIEPPIKVLQTFALPLGDRASEANLFYHFTVGQPLLAVHFRPAPVVGDSQEWLSY